MPRIEFSSDNKVKTFNDYPKLRFEQKGEKARVALLEPSPVVEWVHTLRAPVIVNGQVVMESVKSKEGASSEKVKMDFIGQHVCFGNPNVLAERAQKGSFGDPDNCPTCAAAADSDAIEPPRRRMALHIIRYKTQPGSYKPQSPFQVELLAWVFGEKVFDSIVSIIEEHGDIRGRDLLLECANKMFQNVEVQVGGEAAWLADPANKQFVSRLYAENRSEDLTPLLARKVTRAQAEEDITKVKLRHAQAFGGSTEGAGSAPSGSEASAAVDLDSILSGPSETGPGTSERPALARESRAQDDDLDLSGLSSLMENQQPEPPAVQDSSPAQDSPPAAPVEDPAATDETPEKKDGGDVLDFDSLLKGL